jgi:hypothetical protein
VIWRKRRYRCPESLCGQKFSLSAAMRSCPDAAPVGGYVRRWPALPLEPPPVRRLGIDETRARRVRWNYEQDTVRWRREDPCVMTSLVNLDPTAGRAILGLTPGRSSASVCSWLDTRERAPRPAH